MKKVIQFIALFAMWLLLTWSLNWQDVVMGALAALIVTALTGNIILGKLWHILNPVRLFWSLVYIPYFLWNVLLANFDVAYRVIHPDMPIKPGIIKVKTTLKTDIGRTALANSITLTPGTLTIDIIDDTLYIHWINVKHTDIENASKEIVQRFEKILRRIFE